MPLGTQSCLGEYDASDPTYCGKCNNIAECSKVQVIIKELFGKVKRQEDWNDEEKLAITKRMEGASGKPRKAEKKEEPIDDIEAQLNADLGDVTVTEPKIEETKSESVDAPKKRGRKKKELAVIEAQKQVDIAEEALNVINEKIVESAKPTETAEVPMSNSDIGAIAAGLYAINITLKEIVSALSVFIEKNKKTIKTQEEPQEELKVGVEKENTVETTVNKKAKKKGTGKRGRKPGSKNKKR